MVIRTYHLLLFREPSPIPKFEGFTGALSMGRMQQWGTGRLFVIGSQESGPEGRFLRTFQWNGLQPSDGLHPKQNSIHPCHHLVQFRSSGHDCSLSSYYLLLNFKHSFWMCTEYC